MEIRKTTVEIVFQNQPALSILIPMNEFQKLDHQIQQIRHSRLAYAIITLLERWKE